VNFAFLLLLIFSKVITQNYTLQQTSTQHKTILTSAESWLQSSSHRTSILLTHMFTWQIPEDPPSKQYAFVVADNKNFTYYLIMQYKCD